MSYPATPRPLLSVDAAQVREIVEFPVADAVRLAGTVGGVVSTKTLVVAVLVPPEFVAERVYTVVDVGLIFVEPAGVVVENDPGVMVIDDALATFHERVVEEPTTICEGEALNEEIVGRARPLAALPAALNAATCMSHAPDVREAVAA
jgi:hypothetical protein